MIEFNANFSHKSYKIKIAPKKPTTTKDTRVDMKEEPIDKEISLDRKVIVESLIVRIMKVRKTYDHKNLVRELHEMCKTKHFVPDSAFVAILSFLFMSL